MEDTTQDAPEVLETPEEEIELDLEEDKPEEDVEALKEKNRQLYARAKKAEGFEQVDGKWVKKTTEPAPAPSHDVTLSPKDVIALSKVHDDDIDQVLEWSKFKGVSIAEALKDQTLASILSVNEETRKTAQATQTGRTARGATKATGEDLLRKAEQTGEIPDTDEGMRAIIEAKQQRLRSK